MLTPFKLFCCILDFGSSMASCLVGGASLVEVAYTHAHCITDRGLGTGRGTARGWYGNLCMWLLATRTTRHTCAFLLDTEPLWHRGKRKSRPACEWDSWPWHRPTCKCPPCRFEAIGQLLYSTTGSNQVECGGGGGGGGEMTRLRISHTKATKSHILSRGPPIACHHCGQTLDYWPYAPGVCNVAGKSWRILHSWLIEYSLWDNSWILHSKLLQHRLWDDPRGLHEKFLRSRILYLIWMTIYPVLYSNQ